MGLIYVVLILYTIAFRLVSIFFAETVILSNPPFCIKNDISHYLRILHKGHTLSFLPKITFEKIFA